MCNGYIDLLGLLIDKLELKIFVNGRRVLFFFLYEEGFGFRVLL